MKRNDFIEELINTLEIDVDIVNIGFHKYVDKYLKTILSFDSGNLSIVLSTSLFNENPHIISKIKDENNLKAVISLPVYNNEDNLLILMFDSDKTLNQFIYIDKSDSLIHKEVKNWKYINDELISEISNSYSDFVEIIESIQKYIGCDRMAFAKELYNQKLPDRYGWLEDKVREKLDSDNVPFTEYNKVIIFVRQLHGGM